MLKALTTSLAAILFLTCAPTAAFAQDDDEELPRRRQRLTAPIEEESDTSASTKAGRSRALPIESDDSDWEDGVKPSDPKPAPAPRPVADDESPRRAQGDEERSGARPAARGEESWDEAPAPARSRPRADDGDDWRDDDRPRRTTRTAEEDLREDESRPRRLANRDEPGYGMAAEVLLGSAFVHDAVDGSDAAFAFGLSFAWQMGRLFAPENRLLHKGLFLEAAWLHPLGASEGTESVKVSSSQHDLWLAVLFGYPFKDFNAYAKFGPAMYVQPVAYDVQGTMTEWSGVKGGVVYGLGARMTRYLTPDVGFAVRAELTRFRRGYLDETLLQAGGGVAF